MNEEKLICTFNHMKYFYKEEFYQKKLNAPRLRRPFFIEYNDHIHGTPPKPPKGFCQRLKFLRKAAAEARTGLLYVDEDHATEKNDPSIWTCGYCRCTNYEFEREKRRSGSYSDIIRYYKYNDLLPPEFGFGDSDIQFLEHIQPPLCDNCFRLRFWVKRHVVIEALIAFYLYYLIIFTCIKLPLFVILMCLTLIVAILTFIVSIIVSIVYAIWYLFRSCFRKIKSCCCDTICGCCIRTFGNPKDLTFKEQVERHQPLSKQRLIMDARVVSKYVHTTKQCILFYACTHVFYSPIFDGNMK